MIEAGGYLLLFRSQTGVALNNDGDWVRLLYPDRAVADELASAAELASGKTRKTISHNAAGVISQPTGNPSSGRMLRTASTTSGAKGSSPEADGVGGMGVVVAVGAGAGCCGNHGP